MSEELDKDYIKYLRESGKSEEAIFIYLDHLCEIIYEMREAMGLDTEKETEDKGLMGMYKIQPQGGGGAKKGPPPIIV